MKLVLFSHGMESGPIGTKIIALTEVAKKLNFHTISVDYTKCMDANERVALLNTTLAQYNTDNIILVGSSMGGYVSTVVASQKKVKGLFLMCPALYMPNYPIQEYKPLDSNIEIVHGWLDDVVPFESSIKFGKANSAKLHMVNDDHRLKNSLKELCLYFADFLKRQQTTTIQHK